MKITLGTEVIVVLVVIVLFLVASIFIRRKFTKIDKTYFKNHWDDLQKLCSNKTTWSLAVINADNLLDQALKNLHYKGKNMGERLVSAQHSLTNNDAVWFSHKYRNLIVHETDVKLKQKDVKTALVGFRQALKDLKVL